MRQKSFAVLSSLMLLISALVTPSHTATAALTEEETDAWSKGEISQAQYAIGGFVGTFILPFGVGQAIEGRYLETGWIFTVGEISSIALMAGGLVSTTSSCSNGTSFSGTQTINCSTSVGGLFWVGLAGYLGFRIWEIVDVWVGPSKRNAAYRRAKEKLQPDGKSGDGAWMPYVAPVDGSTLALGLQLRF